MDCGPHGEIKAARALASYDFGNTEGGVCRLVSSGVFQPRIVWVKAALTHDEHDKGAWQ
jgi:hypothetical protein